MERHLIVISEDAMVYEDLAYLQTLPNYAPFFAQSSRVKRLRTIYPSVTYPVHTSIRTGAYPCRHGIVNNEQTIMDEVSPNWVFFNESVRVPDIFDAAKAAGLTTASVFWPVTGNHPSIDYLVNEYWPQSPSESSLDCYRHSGSTEDVIQKIVAPNVAHVEHHHRQHPYIEKFITGCACAMIREYRPNLLLLHPANIDAYRHKTGVFSERVSQGVYEADERFGDIVKALEDVDLLDKTDIVLMSDHGQMNIVRAMCVNVLLREAGLLTVRPDGALADYRAIVKSAGMSAHVYVKDPKDEPEVYRLLCEWRDAGLYGFERVYTAREARAEEGLAGDFSFVLETDGYSSFHNDWNPPLVRPLDLSDYKYGRATHGANPDKGPQPPFVAFGPHVKKGVEIERRPIVDAAPTFARLLGVDMPDTDGSPITEILA